MADHVLNAEGLSCPLPILKAKKALKGIAVGETLEILTTDPGSISDFSAFCNETGHKLLRSDTTGPVYTFEIMRA